MASPQTQTVTQRMDPLLASYYRRLLPAVEQFAGQPYQPFSGQRIAGFSPLEQASYSGIGALGMAGLPQSFLMGEAAGGAALGQLAPAAGMGYGDLSGIAAGVDPLSARAQRQAQTYAGQFGGLSGAAGQTQMWPDVNLPAYMNPFQQQVTDIAARQAQEMGQRQLAELGSNMALQGAFGGSRQALLEGDILRGTREQVADITAAGQRDAYQAAMQQFNADRAARLQGLGQAGQLLGQGLGATQFGMGFGLDALARQQAALEAANQLYQQGAQGLMSGAGAMADIGGMGQGMNIDLLNLMNQAGQQQRGVQQAALDVGFQDYLRQQQYPMQQFGFMANILGGLPAGGDTTFSTFQQPRSLFGSLLGTGIGAGAMQGNLQQGGAR